LYLILGFWSGLVGSSLSLIIRLELGKPGILIFDGHLYNVVVTSHAMIIIFFMVIPTIVGGFGNFLLPVFLLSPDIRFPRLNNLSY
jgi:cytochrome c oxidase subunit 1